MVELPRIRAGRTRAGHIRAGRIRAAVVTAPLVVGLVGPVPATPAVAYPTPDPLPPVTAGSLDERYAATQRAVWDTLAVARNAGGAAGARRAATLESLLGRSLLRFDGRGSGRAVEVIGDLPHAERIAVVVPGSNTTLDTFDRSRGPGGGARALAAEVGAMDPRSEVATVGWLGYDPPQGISYQGITDQRARAGADALRTTVATVRNANREAAISLLCHSYGSVVCAYAAADLPVADIVLYGSPGVVAETADHLTDTARVWAGRATGDWIRFVPSARLAGVGFGRDPVEPEFGARVFAAGHGAHGDYHLPGGEGLRNLALIVLGTAGSGTAAAAEAAEVDRG